MRGKLLDIHFDRSRETLRPQRVVPQRRAIGVLQQRQTMLGARLVRRDQRRRVLNGCGRSRQVGNACFVAVVHRVPSIPREGGCAGMYGLGSGLQRLMLRESAGAIAADLAIACFSKF